MAKMTKEQLQKINNSCKNEWTFDLQYFLMHSEKTLIKHITIDDENYLQFKIDFDYENKIILRISKFHHKANDYFASSSGLGKKKILEETPAPRKSINKLIRLTEKLTDNELMKINNETDVIKNIIFIPSEAF